MSALSGLDASVAHAAPMCEHGHKTYQIALCLPRTSELRCKRDPDQPARSQLVEICLFGTLCLALQEPMNYPDKRVQRRAGRNCKAETALLMIRVARGEINDRSDVSGRALMRRRVLRIEQIEQCAARHELGVQSARTECQGEG